MVAVVIELTFVPCQQLRYALLVYSQRNHKSRGFCYPVLLSSCDILHGWFKEFRGRRLLQRRLTELHYLYKDIEYL